MVSNIPCLFELNPLPPSFNTLEVLRVASPWLNHEESNPNLPPPTGSWSQAHSSPQQIPFPRSPGEGKKEPKTCFSKAFFQNAGPLKESPQLHFALRKKRKSISKLQSTCEQSHTIQGDVNQMPSMLGLPRSLCLEPTFENQMAVVAPELASCLPNPTNAQQAVYVLWFLFFSPNIMKNIFDKPKSLG